MSECQCTFAKKLTGDGCEVCNPAKALEYAKEEIEYLRDERNSLERDLAKYIASYSLEGLKKDAERYRWLRENSNKVSYCLLCGYDGLDCWEGSDFDIQIDAAIGETK